MSKKFVLTVSIEIQEDNKNKATDEAMLLLNMLNGRDDCKATLKDINECLSIKQLSDSMYRTYDNKSNLNSAEGCL